MSTISTNHEQLTSQDDLLHPHGNNDLIYDFFYRAPCGIIKGLINC